jgi:DNA mismatch endonuclease (patch repair protein)
MQANRGRDTGPELAVRRALHARGLRYRVNLSIPLSGSTVRPDIIFTRNRVAVFIDGCFWHGCQAHGTRPARNAAYWSAKISRNQERDAQQSASLEKAGWTVLRFWEHVPPDEAVTVIARAVAESGTEQSRE